MSTPPDLGPPPTGPNLLSINNDPEKGKIMTSEISQEEIEKTKFDFEDSSLDPITPLALDIPYLPLLTDYSPSLTEPIFIKGNKHTKRKRFDYLFGLEYGNTRLKEFYTTVITHTEEETDFDIDEVELSGQSIGLSLAFSPFKNVWLKTGLHRGNLTYTREYNWRFLYLDENNIIDTQLELINLLRFSTFNRIANVENELYALIRQPAAIDFGDALFYGGAEFMKYSVYQIPLSIGYDLPLNSISLSTELGLRWQSSRLVEYAVEGEFNSGEETIELQAFESSFDEMENTSPLNEITYFGGLGIKYDINNKWLIHTSIQLELGNTKSRIDDQGLFSPKGRRFGLGLYYKL